MERAARREHVEALGAAVGLAVPAGELDRALVGLGAGVGEEHRAAAAEQRVEARRDLRLPLVEVEVRHVQQRAGLVGDRVGDGRVRVAERRDREAAEEVEVLLALAVPELHALAAHERDREPAVGLHARARRRAPGCVERAGFEVRHDSLTLASIIVPMPSRVKNSSSSACGMRPSRMCARRTPPRSASTHDAQLRDHARRRPCRRPSSASSPATSVSRDERRLVGVVGVEAGDVGEVHELLGLQRQRDRAGHGVGVDVVGLAELVDARPWR